MLQLKASGVGAGGYADFDATVVLGRPGEAAPGILFLHGGPHSAYAASYAHSVAFLASLGYNVVIPNYRWLPCCSQQTSARSERRCMPMQLTCGSSCSTAHSMTR